MAIGDESEFQPGGNCGVILQHAGRALLLLPGKYVIGRSSSCQLVIRDSVVSRRHALLKVFSNQSVMLRDLNSHNGVLVNGQLIGEAVTPLNEGDVFIIGSEVFGVSFANSNPDPGRTKIEELTEQSHNILRGVGAAELDDTQATNDLDIVCADADKAILAGQIQHAEQILTNHLQAVLIDVQGNQRTSGALRKKAFQYSLRLAEATRNAGWFNFGIDLLIAQSIVCTEEQAESLFHVQKQFKDADLARLQRYAALVHRKAPTIENVRIAERLDAVIVAAISRRS